MRILIGTPNFTGSMESDVTVRMSRCIREWSKDHDVHWSVLKRTFICKARSLIVNEALRLGADYLFWIDDDAVVPVDILPKLLAHKKDIVITPYPLRQPPYLCGVLRSKTGDYEDQMSYVNLDWEDDLNKGLIEVDGGGTHCMLVKTSIYGPPLNEGESVAGYSARCPGQFPYPWFVLSPFGGTEDMYMCLIAKRHGLKIYCDTDVEAAHIGHPQLVTSGNFKSWKKTYGLKTLAEVLENEPEGLPYIDVGNAVSSVETPTTPNTLDANADVESGPELVT